MDQGIGVQHFERRAEFFNAFRKRTRNHAPGFHAKNGAQPLAASEHAMPHCLVDGDGMLRGRWEQSLQRRVGQRLSLLQSLVEHAGEYNKADRRGVLSSGAPLFERALPVWGGHSCAPLLKLILGLGLVGSRGASELWGTQSPTKAADKSVRPTWLDFTCGTGQVRRLRLGACHSASAGFPPYLPLLPALCGMRRKAAYLPQTASGIFPAALRPFPVPARSSPDAG